MDDYEKKKYAEEQPKFCDAQEFCSTCPLKIEAEKHNLKSCILLEERLPDVANKVVEHWYLNRDYPEE